MVINPPVFLKKDGEIQKITGGTPLAEIFEVRVISGGKKYSKIHGEIRIGSNSGLLFLFDRSRLNPQIVHRKDRLELVGPSLAIKASGDVAIALHLTDDRNRVIRVVVNWALYHDAYDMVYSDVFYGRKGSIQISYVVYFHAVVATIAITFKPNRSVGAIYGSITASNKMFPHWRSILFDKKRGDSLLSVFEHEEEVELPLLRSVVAVPSSSTSICKMDPADRKFDYSVYKYGDSTLPNVL